MKKQLALMMLISAIVLGTAACASPEEKTNADQAQKLAVSTEEPATKDDQKEETTPSGGQLDKEIFDVKEMLSESSKDAELEKALMDQMKLSEEDYKQTRYYYNHIDLNEDGKDETLVLLVGPSVSGTGGDLLMLFSKNDKGYEFMQNISLAKNPIVISNDKTEGYRDIIMQQGGGGSQSEWKVLKHTGNGYSDMNNSQALPKDAKIKGDAIITNDVAKDFEESKGLFIQ